jgi:hypothetical protein
MKNSLFKISLMLSLNLFICTYLSNDLFENEHIYLLIPFLFFLSSLIYAIIAIICYINIKYEQKNAELDETYEIKDIKVDKSTTILYIFSIIFVFGLVFIKILIMG